ncbi:MAG: DUF4174 domain-containing protein [Paracoccaceae bacterium]
MLRTLTALMLMSLPLAAQTPDAPRPAADIDIADYLWTHRPLVVFADSPADPRFVEQMTLLQAGAADLLERDVIVITDTAPAEPSALRQKLRPRGFSLVLIGKDGSVKLRKPLPWDVRELRRSIDKMPMRQQEIRARRAAKG